VAAERKPAPFSARFRALIAESLLFTVMRQLLFARMRSLAGRRVVTGTFSPLSRPKV
jgi:hypothetical protein